MKKILLSFVVSGSFLFASAQPTWDFESWTGSGVGIEPSGWVSGNAITSPPFNNPQSVFQETTAGKVHSGTYSMKLVTVTLTNNPSPTTIPNPMGAAFPGAISFSPLGLKDGCAFGSRPNTVQFWYQYTPTGGDSASCFVMLSKWNGASRDTIAVGGVVIQSAASSYTQSTITMQYLSTTLIPDSMRLYFSATCYTTLTCGTAGSTLWVDDITFSGWNGINEHPSSTDVIVYPNPASSYVNVIADVNEAASVIAYDMTGRMVSTTALSSSNNGSNRMSGVINTSDYSAGLYSYSVLDKDGNALRNGTFNVVK